VIAHVAFTIFVAVDSLLARRLVAVLALPAGGRLGVVIITGGVACPFTTVENDLCSIASEHGDHGASPLRYVEYVISRPLHPFLRGPGAAAIAAGDAVPPRRLDRRPTPTAPTATRSRVDCGSGAAQRKRSSHGQR
jgi:hypothetical protein